MNQKCRSFFPPGQSMMPSYFVIYVPFQAGTDARSSFLHEFLTILTLPVCQRPKMNNSKIILYIYILV